MVGLMACAAVVAVVQLALLGSWARSLRVVTLLQAIGIGFLVCGPAVVGVQWLVTRGIAALGPELSDVVNTASWTFDPVIEEVGKLVPLAVLAWKWPRVHRQLGWVDHLLAGAAVGMGFALAEAALRHGRLGFMATEVPGGYLVHASLGGTAVVPSLWTSLTTWQPAPVTYEQWLGSSADSIHHLVWTGLAAVGLAWLVRAKGGPRWFGLVPLAAVSFDHCAFNAGVSGVTPGWLTELTGLFGSFLAILLPAALLVLVGVDRLVLAQARAGRPELLLAGEAANGLRPWPAFQAAGRGLPWSGLVTWQLVLERRAALNALAAGVAPPALAEVTTTKLARLGRATDADRWRTAGRKLTAGFDPTRLLNWRVALWLVSVAPAVLYLGVGGFPATRWIQAWLTDGIGIWLVVAGLVLGGGLVGSQLPGLVRRVRGLQEPVVHEARLRPAGRLVASAGTLAAAVGLLLVLAVSGDPGGRIVRNFHILDALSDALLILGLALLLAAFIFFPPAGLAVTTTGVLVPTLAISAEFAALSALGVTAIAGQLLLNEASGEGGPESGGSGSGGSGRGQPQWEADSVKSGRFTESDLPRLRDLSRDPAHGGARSRASWAEAEVGHGLEKGGKVRGLQRSPNPGEEFIDSAGRAWDVKAFRSNGFNLEKAMQNIQRELRVGENVMLDTRHLSAEDFLKLDEALTRAGHGGRVLWWP